MTMKSYAQADEPVCFITEVAENVYAYGPGTGLDGVSNSGIVVTDEGVLVVDTTMLPARARLLGAAIGQITDRPVTHVVNTHFHGDHVFGNQVFVPPATLIAHEGARGSLARVAASYPGFWAQSRPQLGEQFAEIRMLLPSVTFSKDLTLWIGGREIRLLHFGHGHTSGDLVVYLPDARVVMTGDLVENRHHPVLRDSIPTNWPKLVRRVGALAIATIIPGHGAVGGPDMIDAFDEYLTAVYDESVAAYRSGRSVEQAIESITLPQFASWTGNPQWKLPLAIRRCYAEIEDPDGLDEASVCECEAWAIANGTGAVSPA